MNLRRNRNILKSIQVYIRAPGFSFANKRDINAMFYLNFGYAFPKSQILSVPQKNGDIEEDTRGYHRLAEVKSRFFKTSCDARILILRYPSSYQHDKLYIT